MTKSWTVCGISRLLVLVPVTVCATITYADDVDLVRCADHKAPQQILAKCDYDNDCVDNAYCWNQRGCLCKPDYIVYRNRTHVQCLKVATSMGDPCVADVQCQVTFTPHAECRENACQCSTGSLFEDGRCYQSVGLGEVCQTHHNCHVKDSYCVRGFCACTLQHHPSSDNSRCLRNAQLADSCTRDDECVTDNSRCIMDNCSCKVDHVMSGDRKKCLKAANSIGDSCEEHSQCLAFLKNSVCEDGTCNCIMNYHQRGSVCYRDVGLKNRCNIHQECITPQYTHSRSTEVMNVDCVNEICTCANDYATMNNECIRFSESGSMRPQSFWLPLLAFVAGFQWRMIR